MSSEHLWVYGSLRRGCSNPFADLLARSARYVGAARVQGRLYRVSWYPGIRLAGEPADWVLGDLFELIDPATLPALDEYEGSEEFRRLETLARLEDGREVTCWVYEYFADLSEDRRIVSGDWLSVDQHEQS